MGCVCVCVCVCLCVCSCGSAGPENVLHLICRRFFSAPPLLREPLLHILTPTETHRHSPGSHSHSVSLAHTVHTHTHTHTHTGYRPTCTKTSRNTHTHRYYTLYTPQQGSSPRASQPCGMVQNIRQHYNENTLIRFLYNTYCSFSMKALYPTMSIVIHNTKSIISVLVT